jgi:Mg-chelatase subunit ChlD
MNLTSQEYLAKLLAKENLTIQHGNYQTASFDVVDRVLRLPLWEDKGKAVYDLLVGHEVGHALYTPCQGWHDTKIDVEGIPRVYLNIIEDIRIERKIQETYPGIVKQFKAGYKRLFDDNLFGTNDREITSLMDKLNIHSKGRGIVPIEFDADEQPLVDEAMVVQTWDDVVDISRKIHKFLEEKKEEQENEESKTQSPSEDSDDGESSQTQGGQQTPETGGESSDEESSPEKGDPTETFTDETFRENEEKLLEGADDQWGDKRQPQYTSGISPENMEKVVTPYKELMEARAALDYSKTCYVYSDYITDDWMETKKHLESTANLLAKDFERKKAAYEYSRSTESKKGSLNMNKIHQYKYSEDIFLTVTKLAQAKSHGIVMFVDLSGSMADIIQDVIKQTITIAMFCKKVSIPFDVYTFTSRFSYERDDSDDITTKGNEIDSLNCVRIVQVLSSTMKTKEFKLASRDLFGMSKLHNYSYDRPYYLSRTEVTKYDDMGTTPLIETSIVAYDIVNKFQRKYGIQKTNIMFLTDGYANNISINIDDSAPKVSRIDSYKIALNFKGKILKGHNNNELYEVCLGRLRELTGAKITGFFLAQSTKDYHHGFHGMNVFYDERKTLLKKWRKEHIISLKKTRGYDDYFIVKVGDNKQEEEFAPKKTEKISDIRNEFKKFNKGKKIVKQLVNKITDAVAA